MGMRDNASKAIPIIGAALASACVIVAAFLSNNSITTEETAGSQVDSCVYHNYELIAHAGGALYDENGETLSYLNTVEAIESNYSLGHRVFEIDFQLTSDGQLALVHDWSGWEEVPTMAEWKSAVVSGKYPAANLDDLVEIMKKYPDIFIVTDTKYDDAENVQKSFAQIEKVASGSEVLLDRFVPQIYHAQMLGVLDEIYEFPEIIYTLYMSPQTPAEVAEFIKDQPRISAVTVESGKLLEWAEYGQKFVESINDLSRVIYAHTVNNQKTFDELRDIGVYGVYTDTLVP